MHFKLSTLALVALLGFQAHAQVTAADMVNDLEKIDGIYDEAIDYLTSNGPDSADFNSRMNGFFSGLINSCEKAIADSEIVQLSTEEDDLSVAKTLKDVERTEYIFNLMINGKAATNAVPSAECIENVKLNLLSKMD